jgi:hypothetical protein
MTGNAGSPAGAPAAPDRYRARPVDALLAALGSTAAGLGTAEAARRRLRFGPNAIGGRLRASALRLLLRQFASPLMLILVAAAVIAAIGRDWTDAGIVLAILLGSALLSFSQEFAASNALERLRSKVRSKTTALRDGRTPTATAGFGRLVRGGGGGEVRDSAAARSMLGDPRLLRLAGFRLAQIPGDHGELEPRPLVLHQPVHELLLLGRPFRRRALARQLCKVGLRPALPELDQDLAGRPMRDFPDRHLAPSAGRLPRGHVFEPKRPQLFDLAANARFARVTGDGFASALRHGFALLS